MASDESAQGNVERIERAFWIRFKTNVENKHSSLCFTRILSSDSLGELHDLTAIRLDAQRTICLSMPEKLEIPEKSEGNGEGNGEGKIPEEITKGEIEAVLIAFAVFCPRIGYISGMNFIVYTILKELKWNQERMPQTIHCPFGDIEDCDIVTCESTFWIFVGLMESSGLIKLLNNHTLLLTYLTVLDQLIELRLPSLSQTFEHLGITSCMYAAPWFTTLFSRFSLIEASSVVKLWKVFITQGLAGLLRVSIAILKILEPIMSDASLEISISILNGYHPLRDDTTISRRSSERQTSNLKSNFCFCFTRSRSARLSTKVDSIGQVLDKLTVDEIIKQMNGLNITNSELDLIPGFSLATEESKVLNSFNKRVE